MSNIRSTIWIDAQGRTRQTILRGTGSLIGPTLSAVEADLAALSNAGVTRSWESAEVNPGGTGTNAQYPTVADYAELVYTAGDGSAVYITLVAPKAAVFLADGETVDATAVVGLTADVVGTIITATGATVTAFAGGVRRRKLQEYQ